MTQVDDSTVIERGPRPGPEERTPRADERDDLAQLTDSGLVSSIAAGSHEALAEAYSRHGAGVRDAARRLCGRDRAADVAQEVFLGLWRTPGRFDGDRGSLRAFLLVQAHGRAVDVLRSDTARRAREAACLDRDTKLTPPVDDQALALLAGKDAMCLLSRLDDAERHAITLAYFGGHTYREVAQLLGLPEGTVKSRIRVGLGRIRAGLSTDDSEADEP